MGRICINDECPLHAVIDPVPHNDVACRACPSCALLRPLDEAGLDDALAAGMKAGEAVPIKHRGKSVGHITKDGRAYLTFRARHIHYVRKYEGYGIDRRLLKNLVAMHVQVIVLNELVEGQHARRFRVSPEWWLKCGYTDVLAVNDGVQSFVSLRQLEKTVKENPLK